MNQQDKQLAIYWYVNCNYDLSTIAQHFDVTVEQLKKELNNQ